MNRINRLILTAVLTLALCSSAGSFFTASLAQEGRDLGTRKPPCGCYVCGALNIPGYVVFGFGTGNCMGILAEDACQEYLGSNRASPETRRSFCNQVKAKGCPSAPCDSPNGKYCDDNMPEKGALFASGTPVGKYYSEASTDSAVIGTFPNGTRVVYSQTTRIDGQRWYYIHPPGRPAGWMPGSEVSCARPGEPRWGESLIPRGRGPAPTDPRVPTERPTAAIVSGARG